LPTLLPPTSIPITRFLSPTPTFNIPPTATQPPPPTSPPQPTNTPIPIATEPPLLPASDTPIP
jgi:hypothetical protein